MEEGIIYRHRMNLNKGFTHGGKFHADDVFSAALLTYINPHIKIERGFAVPENFDGIVFDIGMGEFDHHQNDSLIRENGIPYAAFGLLWKEFGTLILGDDARKFDESFVEPLDLSDNTGSENQLAQIISMFNPVWDSNKSLDLAFQDAKKFALKILENYFTYSKSNERADLLLKEEIKKAQNHILILSRFIPWKRAVMGTDLYFVIYPSKRGGYCVQSISVDGVEGSMKIPFPVSWRGKEREELVKCTGINTLEFCHKSGFLIAVGNVDDAVIACHITMQGAETTGAE